MKLFMKKVYARCKRRKKRRLCKEKKKIRKEKHLGSVSELFHCNSMKLDFK